MVKKNSPMNRLLQSPDTPMTRKRIVAPLLYFVLVLSSADIHSSTIEPFRPATPEAKAAFAQHASKDGLRESAGGAIESSPEVPSQGSRDALNERFASDMKSLSEAEIGRYAAAFFLAFYVTKARIVPGVCESEGVDLEAYSNAFQLEHAAMFNRADQLMSASRLSATQMVSKVYKNRTIAEANVRRRLLELASKLQKPTVADGCVYLASHVIDGASMPSFEEEFPDAAGVLMSVPIAPGTSAAGGSPEKRTMNDGRYGAGNVVVVSSSDPRFEEPVDTVTDRIAADIKSLPTDDVKKYAASHFLAFYNIRTRVDRDVCRDEGVDISAYVLAFKIAYGVEFARADILTMGTRFSNAQVITDLDAERERGLAVSREVFVTLAKRLGKTTIADGCRYLVVHASDGLGIQSFAEQFPELYEIFMSDESPKKRPESLPASNPYLGKKINRRRATHDESTETSR
jgi:hypothetical protein